jgi:hypothetical protein
MATTDARPGFKLPWSSDRHESDSNDTGGAVHSTLPEDGPAEAAEQHTGDLEATVHEVIDPSPVATEHSAFDPWRLGPARPVEAAPKRKPNKLMADLTKAMQGAAEAARNETLDRLQADAKAFIEGIHTRSGTESEELRRTADADVASIREWSKAEIARIREETDSRVAARKGALESEIEQHAALIEQRIERVQAHVAWFEAEMAGFFERILAEDDPTQLAAMAENLPEPPTFDDAELEDLPARFAPAAVVDTSLPESATDNEPEVEAEAVAEVPATDDDPEAAFAAIQAAAEAAESDGEATAIAEPETAGEDAPVDAAALAEDPRLGALGLSAEAAAEAEAEAEAPDEAGEIATFSDDALAARLAGLVPAEGEAVHADLHATKVVVTGLISVASIASFKRQLGRLDGVGSVGVSSGPDGEFIFAVNHGPDVRLAEAIPALPGFAARVTDTTDDTVTVAARDPETDS